MVIVSITPDLALDYGYTYAGGLGVLEGDKFYTASRLGLRYIVLTLLYRRGYVDYEFKDTEPLPKPQKHPEIFWEKLVPLEEFKVKLKGEDVIVRPWFFRRNSANVIFFESVCPTWARSLTERIYIERNIEEKFLKYLFLAKSSAYYIENFIGIENIDYIDLQEAYTALLPLILPINKKYRLIIHTPGPWGHPTFPKELIERELGWSFIAPQVVLTEIGLSLVEKAFVVSQKQLDVIKNVFPHYIGKIHYITNGIDIERWMNTRTKKLYEEKKLSIETFRDVHEELRKSLLKMLRLYKEGIDLNGEKMIVTWARRIVRYKRPEFMAWFIERNHDLPVIYVLAGKAHPHDTDGLKRMMMFKKLSNTYKNVVFIHDYDVSKAKILLQGSDLLTFTPFSGWEACGTSYMKAGVNGIPTISSRDGGALEIIIDGFNGWLFGKDLREFINIYRDPRVEKINREDYEEFSNKLRNIVELYFSDREKFYEVCINAIKSFVPRVNIVNSLKAYYSHLIK
ncbi:MAG: glycosyl transferase family 1 [Thermoprotei archaeon]|nr:MAG: glycosyl transferase family 1 [Thermoprotei archaeon]